MKDWKSFAERIIEKDGNPSLKDATECGIPAWCFNELCMRSLTNTQLKENAEKLLKKYEKIN